MDPLRGDARRAVRRAQRRPVAGLETGLLEQLALGGRLGLLARDVQQTGRQLEHPHPGRVAVLAQAEHPLLVVDGEDHDGSGCSSTTRVNGSSSAAARAPYDVRAEREGQRRTGRGPRCSRPASSPGHPPRSVGHAADVTVRAMTDPEPAVGLRQPDRAGGPRARRADRGRALRHHASTCASCSRATALAGDVVGHLQVPDAGRRDVRRHRRRGGLGPAQRRRARPVDPRGRPAAAPVARGRQRAGRLVRADRDRIGRTRSCAASTRRTSSSTSGRRSSRTAPGARGPASTSPTSRRCTASRSARPPSGRSSATARRRSCSTATTAAGCGSSRTPRGSRRTSWWSTPGPFHELREQRGDHSLGPLLPAVTAVLPGAGRRGPVPGHRAGAGLLRGAVRHAVPAGALRPGLRARLRRRDGELGLRHLDRRRAVADSADPLTARARRHATSCTRWRTCGSATW